MKAHKMRFDTHQYVKKAKAVGFSEQQAEFQAEEMFHILWDNIDSRFDQLATKEELTATKEELKLETTRINHRLNQCVTKEEFNHEITLLRKDLHHLDIKLETKIMAVDSKLTWLISLFGLASVMISVISLLHGFHVI